MSNLSVNKLGFESGFKNIATFLGIGSSKGPFGMHEMKPGNGNGIGLKFHILCVFGMTELVMDSTPTWIPYPSK